MAGKITLNNGDVAAVSKLGLDLGPRSLLAADEADDGVGLVAGELPQKLKLSCQVRIEK